MKAIIVEIKNGFAAVLSDDGNISRVKDKNYELGQVITVKKQMVHITKKLAIGVASAVILFLSSSAGVWAYTSPYSYVSLDINPSIEYTVNRFDMVIDVKPVNDDGEEILSQINLNNLNNKKISDAITTTINQIADSGYFNGTAYEPVTAVSSYTIRVDDKAPTKENTVSTGGIVITTSCEYGKKSEDLALKLEGTVNEAVEKTGDDVEVEVVSVGYDSFQRARALGVTPGKLKLVEKLQASAKDPESINIQEWLNKPVKDIMKATKANREGIALIDTQETSDHTTKTIEETNKAENKNEESKKAELTDKEKKKALKAEEKAKKVEEKTKRNAERKKEQEAEKAKREAERKKEQEAVKAKREAEKAKRDIEKAERKKEHEVEKAEREAEKAKLKAEKAESKKAHEDEKAERKAQKA